MSEISHAPGWKTLVARAQAGERPAFDRLFALVAERLALFVRLHTGARLAAQVEVVDVLQETYLQAWRSLETFEFRGERALLAWLCRIAENRLRDLAQNLGAVKRGAGRERIEFEHVLELARESATGPVTAAARGEARERLSDALDRLKDDEREVLLLRYFQERELEDIAGRVSLSVSAVRRLLGRAVERLGRALSQAGAGSDRSVPAAPADEEKP